MSLKQLDSDSRSDEINRNLEKDWLGHNKVKIEDELLIAPKLQIIVYQVDRHRVDTPEKKKIYFNPFHSTQSWPSHLVRL